MVRLPPPSRATLFFESPPAKEFHVGHVRAPKNFEDPKSRNAQLSNRFFQCSFPVLTGIHDSHVNSPKSLRMPWIRIPLTQVEERGTI